MGYSLGAGTFTPTTLPEINLVGNGNTISSGDAASVANDTDFGALAVASGSDTHTFTIQNTGTGPLTVSSVTSNSAEFAVNIAGLSSPIAAGSSGTFTVTFDPAASGARNATIAIASDDADEGTYTLPMTGTGFAPDIAITSSITGALNDGDTDAQGNRNAASNTTINYTLENTGTAPLTVTGIPITNQSNVIASTTTTMFPFFVPAGTSTVVQVTYSPVVAGPFNFEIDFESNDADENPFDVTVSGSGTGDPEFTLFSSTTPSVIDDGDTDTQGNRVAGTPVTITYTVNNAAGFDTLNITDIDVANESNVTVGVITPTTLSVPPGAATADFTVTYTPTIVGLFSFDLQIANNDPNEDPYNVRVSGTATGTPEIDESRGGTAIADNGSDAQGNQAAGTAVTLTYTVANTGTDTLNVSNIATSGATNVTVGAPSTTTLTVAPGASSTFTIDYTPTIAGAFDFDIAIASDDADENPYDIAVSGTATGEADLAVSSSIGGAVADGGTDPQGGQAIGAPFTVTYTVSNTGSLPLAITDIATTGLSNVTDATPSTMTLTVAPGASGAFTVTYTPSSAGPFAFDLDITSNDPDESPYDIAVTGTGDGSAIRRRTQAIASNFMTRRADQITANDPDLLHRFTDRSAGSGGTSVGGVGFSASGTFENGQLGFSTNLRQMVAAANADRDRERIELGRALGFSDTSVLAPGLDPNGIDVWIQGTWAHVDGETSDTDLGLFYAGIDYRVSPSFLFGVLGQFDWSDEQDATNGFSIDGQGWLVGPYVVARLNDTAVFEGRLGWGRSENDISPFNTYTDTFDTERWLAKAKLTGQFDMGGWQFSPHIAFLYFGEEQKAYTDSNNIFIPGQSIDLGRLTFGPEVSSRWTVSNGVTLAGHLGIKGIWDFAAPELRDLDTGRAADATEGVRARIEGGASVALPNGWNLTGEGFFDGIGTDDLDAYGVRVRVTLPLH
ncbi:MAG: choice-of-anchor D domain-containing protein [Pseudomonadota bacterium]